MPNPFLFCKTFWYNSEVKKNNELLLILKKALKKSNFIFDENEIILDYPKNSSFGDLTTNIALILAGKNSLKPIEVAKKIIDNLELNDNFSKVEIAGPGYLNFYFSEKFFDNYLNDKEIIKKKKREKILLEHSSPNMFKPFHIGHLVNNSIGESIGRVYKEKGYDLKQVSFPSDVSPGIAKAVWALKKKFSEVDFKIKDIAEAYVEGVKKYEEDEDIKKEIDLINSEIYNFLNNKKYNDKRSIEFYQKGLEISLNHFKEIVFKLGTCFDKFIFESEAEKKGKEIILKNIDNVFKKSEGAIIFEGSEFTNVFINSAGFGTYLAKDLGLLKIKKEFYSDFKKSLVITDIEQKKHFLLLREAGEKINELADFLEKSLYISHGRMSFIGSVKISSRYGNVPLVTELIEKISSVVLEKMKDKDFNEKEKKEISEKIAIANLKYSILKVSAGKNIVFDFEKDLDIQGNTGTYLLYSLVRAKSVLKKNKISKEYSRKGIEDIERLMIQFDERVERSLNEYSPHQIANFLYELSKLFNSFYSQKEISGNDFNLKITEKFVQIMEKGFYLLGFEGVEKM